MKKIFSVALILFFVQFAIAQTVEEAQLYSNQNYYGTARSSAMGGAFSSLGGDITVGSTNPAGLAIFRSSVAAITPGLHSTKTTGKDITGESNNFVLPSIGFVLSTLNDSDADFKNWNFGITYTQASNFNSSKHFSEKEMKAGNQPYSFLDDIAASANNSNGTTVSDLENYRGALLPALAYNTYLISPSNGIYKSALLKDEYMNSFSDISKRGENGELAFSIAGNYKNILYVGATLGIQNLDYSNKDNYEEVTSAPIKETILDKFYYNKYVHTMGTGINLKLGVIFRPIENLRLGLAAHTPTFFNIEEEFFYTMGSAFFEEPEAGKGTIFKQVFPTDGKVGRYEYKYKSPWKFTFGGSYILGKIGLLSVDYDLIDYSTARFSSGDFSNLNSDIEETYHLTGNLKVGSEIRLTNQFSLRGGYNYFGNIYNKNSGKELKASQYSMGLGYRYSNIFIDASYQHYTQKNSFMSDEYSSSENFNTNTIKLTLGYRF